MRILGIAVVVAGLIVVWILLRRIWEEHRVMSMLLGRPFPAHWRDMLRAYVPLYNRLSEQEREHLERHVQLFLGRKQFEACGGLDALSEETQVTIAGNACMLLLGRPECEPFPELKSILVYPGEFTAPGGHDLEPDRDLLGESWSTGSVILSQATVLEDAEAGADGFNVVLHEFAHQLDQEFGDAEGLPQLDCSSQYRCWAGVFRAAFENHERRISRGWKTVIDPYGAENAAEFFACATESFFERPEDLRREIRPVFDQLVRYYRVDPSAWQT